MKIIYITPSFQHPAMRGPTRCYHFLKELSQRHSITLLSLSRSRIPSEGIKEMSRYADRILTFVTEDFASPQIERVLDFIPGPDGRIKNLLRVRKALKHMKSALRHLLEQDSYDLVLLHGKVVFPLIEDLDELPIVLDFCDATSMRLLTRMRHEQLTKLPILGWRYLQMKALEKRMLKKTPHLVFVSVRDREAVLGPGSHAKVVPIGVDLQFWRRTRKANSSNSIAFTGVMDYGPNEDAALFLIRRLLPRLRRSIPDIKIFIVGRDPRPNLVEAARRCPEVTVTGFVKDVRPYLEEACLFLAPLRYGSGVQNKVLEAMAMGVPVVTTPLVAAGLRSDDEDGGLPVEVASGERQLAERVASLMSNAEQRSTLATRGRNFVERHFDWSHSAAMLEELCVEAFTQAQMSRRETFRREASNGQLS